MEEMKTMTQHEYDAAMNRINLELANAKRPYQDCIYELSKKISKLKIEKQELQSHIDSLKAQLNIAMLEVLNLNQEYNLKKGEIYANRPERVYYKEQENA